jgi:two-component system, OmpR family, sensor kinase
MLFNSIRWRLQAWHGLILVSVLAGFGLTAYHVARDNQLRRIDQELAQRLGVVFRPGPPDGPRDHPPDRPPEPGPDQPRMDRRFDPAQILQRMRRTIEQSSSLEGTQTNGFYYVLWQGDGTLVARSPDAPADLPRPEFVPSPAGLEPPPLGQPGRMGEFGPRPGADETRTRGKYREVFRVLPHSECVLVGRNIAADLASMHRFALWLTAAGAAVLLLGLAGGWWLATRAIQPIEDISATAIKIAGGDLAQRISTTDTENELGRLAAVLNSTFARLEGAFAHQARFTSDASHELRTPVAVILTQTQGALSRERSGAEYREALEACQRAAQRMRKLTDSLLELARLDAGEEAFKREPFDLARVAGECVEMLRPLAAAQEIQVAHEFESASCLGDAVRIGQVVTNLLTNAFQFNRRGGNVRVVTRQEPGVAVLTVSDTGEGIPAADLPHIFERFYRVDKSRSGNQGRSGLGLAIAKAIADAHGGSLEVASQPGTGSTFTLKLPLRAS